MKLSFYAYLLFCNLVPRPSPSFSSLAERWAGPGNEASLGMRLLCSKTHLLCYAGMLKTMSTYALVVSLLCSCSKLIN